MGGSNSFAGPARSQSSGLEHHRHHLSQREGFLANQSRIHPSGKVTAAEERVAKLESALAALHGVEGPEVDSLRAALKRAKDVKLTPLDVQAKECEAFLARARAHLTELDAKRAVVSTNIQEAEQRLEALKIQLQHPVPQPPFPDAETELRQLRETVAQLKGQLHHTKSTTVEVPVCKRQCRRDEDFVPMCVEELQEWIGGRQGPISTRKWWQGGQTRRRGSATSWGRPSSSGNEKFLLHVCHPL